MGHIRLGRLPATLKWNEVVAMLADGAGVAQIADASAEAAENSLENAHNDPALLYAFWLLTQLPFAARSANFETALSSLGLQVDSRPKLLDLVAAFTKSIDLHVENVGGRTDFGELAQHAAAESLTIIVGSDLPSLFDPTAEDVKFAIGKLTAPDRFSRLARDFFARLTQRHLDYYLSRTVSNHVGTGKRFSSTDDHTNFNVSLELHCQEASRIVEEFAGGWFSKTHFEGGIATENAGNFIFYALKKIRQELRNRRDGDG